MGERSARIEAGTSSESRLRHRSPRDQRGSSHEPAPGVDAQLADTLASLDRQFERPRRDEPAGAGNAVAVGFQKIRMTFELDSDATPEQIENLLRLTKRYCVVFQTLQQPPAVTVTHRVSSGKINLGCYQKP